MPDGETKGPVVGNDTRRNQSCSDRLRGIARFDLHKHLTVAAGFERSLDSEPELGDDPHRADGSKNEENAQHDKKLSTH